MAYFAGDELQKKVVWFKAAEYGDAERISQLYKSFKNKEDALIRDKLGNTALHIAAKYGNVNIVENLAKLRPDLLEAKGQNDNTALHIAVLQENIDMVGRLIQIEPKLLEAKGQNNSTALHAAIYKKNISIVKKLIKFKINLEAKDEKGDTALHYAVLTESLDIIEKLIDIKPELLKIKGRKGYTALHMAVLNGKLNVVQKLVDFGADLEIKDEEGNTASDLANDKNYEDISSLLEEAMVYQNKQATKDHNKPKKPTSNHKDNSNAGKFFR